MSPRLMWKTALDGSDAVARAKTRHRSARAVNAADDLVSGIEKGLHDGRAEEPAAGDDYAHDFPPYIETFYANVFWISRPLRRGEVRVELEGFA